jgi:peroxiredoxin
VEINRLAPDFNLRDIAGDLHSLRDTRGRITILNFWSCECPHVVRTDRALLAACAKWGTNVAWLSIASNRIESLEAISAAAHERGLPFVLQDPQHAVADLFEAQTTPQVFVIDRDGMLRYRGAVDDVNFSRRIPTRAYVDEAVEAMLAGRLPRSAETPAFGCAIVREAVE